MKLDNFTTSVGTQQNHFFNDTRGRQSNDQSPQIVKEVSERMLKKSDVKLAVNNMNDFIEPVVTNLKFVFHEDLNDYYVTVVDPLTNEVVREIPPKKMLDMYVAMAQYMGLLVDEKV